MKLRTAVLVVLAAGFAGLKTCSDHHPVPPRAADDARFYDRLPADVPAREG